ncbi:hypothetical protein [Streptomyces sp. SID14515]|uniref:hypothetical protein n=1 Tax=Streptomyces sp. SID14515 TaxID=2706074 RepID=UPI0013C78472|nr:hypothetical protein [Streptomyces sp. SID14515]NEB35904.1 hypothetical protein [Streptomyces sp. SID14515]
MAEPRTEDRQPAVATPPENTVPDEVAFLSALQEGPFDPDNCPRCKKVCGDLQQALADRSDIMEQIERVVFHAAWAHPSEGGQ